jgi:hypothetical protein
MAIVIDSDDSIVSKASVITDKGRHIKFVHLMMSIFINDRVKERKNSMMTV